MAMFGLFKKKEKTEEKKTSAPQGEEYRKFAAQFLPEEYDVLVVTGAVGSFAARAEGDELLTVAINLTAWMDQDAFEIHRGNFRLITKADATLAGFLTQRLPRDFILKCRVRLHEEGTLLMLTNVPEPGFDPDLKAILNEQKIPVTEEVEGLTFTMNRASGAFQAELDWADQTVLLCFEQDADRTACAPMIRAIAADLADRVEQARLMAADTLLERVNAMAAEQEAEPLTREEFMDALEPETVELTADGFSLWFNDNGMCFGSAVRVSGNADGLIEAVMEE